MHEIYFWILTIELILKNKKFSNKKNVLYENVFSAVLWIITCIRKFLIFRNGKKIKFRRWSPEMWNDLLLARNLFLNKLGFYVIAVKSVMRNWQTLKEEN